MKMKIKIKGVRNSDLGLRIWGDGSDRTDGTYGTLSYEGQGAGPYREFVNVNVKVKVNGNSEFVLLGFGRGLPSLSAGGVVDSAGGR